MYITYNNLIRFSGALNAPRMTVPKGVRGISLVRQMKLSLQRWEWKKEEEEREKKRRRRRKKKQGENKDKTRKEFRQARRQRPLRSCKKRTREFSSIISTNHEVRFQASKIDNRREYFLFNGNEGVPLKGETSLFSFANLPLLYRKESAKNVIGFACESGSS